MSCLCKIQNNNLNCFNNFKNDTKLHNTIYSDLTLKIRIPFNWRRAYEEIAILTIAIAVVNNKIYRFYFIYFFCILKSKKNS